MLNSEDHELLRYYLSLSNRSATAAQVRLALEYKSVGAVNLHVVRLAKKLAAFFEYSPAILSNGLLQWWPCLFDGEATAQGFMWTLREDIHNWYRDAYAIDMFHRDVYLAQFDAVERAKRLLSTSTTPKKKLVEIWVFERNPDVVAEVLCQAGGHCQCCGKTAPFLRKSDGSPYLEVHHRVPLAIGGEDSVANAIALCPNCHREAHYGTLSLLG
ncbi:MAG: HNH endonuclease [Comamonas sp.]|nr:HNH endonuclease [Candidatus Comamonas equi]